MQGTFEVSKGLAELIEEACEEENMSEAELFRRGVRRELQALEVDND